LCDKYATVKLVVAGYRLSAAAAAAADTLANSGNGEPAGRPSTPLSGTLAAAKMHEILQVATVMLASASIAAAAQIDQ